ncbi:hypothetical protein SZ64_09945 [Erythrobacter sp. SG61-1L]|uniref:phosphonoacetaldehyde hydrolase n=1 Tax=Erythrobacter sp. SG61-1L TaxID=1603897 RepID=UPI0006C90925|nr:phosphonoacetaldehyde hydrolase [Erythrobacter sp. SG61-1L]KPL68412.1 hypothetical protein SZ64_09945 [Erythrobacter sp. SG61-1L]
MSLPVSLSSSRLQAVLFDLAGTLIDFGSMAPVRAFGRAFDAFGISLSDAQIRRPMGSAKRDHIELILAEPDVRSCWSSRFGAEPGPTEIDRLYAEFLEADARLATEHCDPVPGAGDLIASLRARGIATGATTGYPREILDRIAPLIAERGIALGAMVSASDVSNGRPAPDMCLRGMGVLGIGDPAVCLVVDDTLAGIEAGRAAGMWTVGVAASGNEMGLTLAGWEALPAAERRTRLSAIQERMHGAGAHYVIASVADLEEPIAAIEAALAMGERP